MTVVGIYVAEMVIGNLKRKKMKNILNIENVSCLSKKEQKNVHGGNKMSGSCFAYENQQECDNQRECQWFGCYCGPTYPHVAPC